jgi:hypothetical protein
MHAARIANKVAGSLQPVAPCIEFSSGSPPEVSRTATSDASLRFHGTEPRSLAPQAVKGDA